MFTVGLINGNRPVPSFFPSAFQSRFLSPIQFNLRCFFNGFEAPSSRGRWGTSDKAPVVDPYIFRTPHLWVSFLASFNWGKPVKHTLLSGTLHKETHSYCFSLPYLLVSFIWRSVWQSLPPRVALKGPLKYVLRMKCPFTPCNHDFCAQPKRSDNESKTFAKRASWIFWLVIRDACCTR